MVPHSPPVLGMAATTSSVVYFDQYGVATAILCTFTQRIYSSVPRRLEINMNQR
jgi:hypothetical protein